MKPSNETLSKDKISLKQMQNIFETINGGVVEDTIDWIDISLFKNAICMIYRKAMIVIISKNQNASYTNGPTVNIEHTMYKLFEEVISERSKHFIKTELNELFSDNEYIRDYKNVCGRS